MFSPVRFDGEPDIAALGEPSSPARIVDFGINTVGGHEMRFSKPLIAAALAVAMGSAPVLAQTTAPQSAAPLSIAARSGASMKDSNQYYNSYLLPALVIIAVLAAAILLSNNNNDGIDNPFSP